MSGKNKPLEAKPVELHEHFPPDSNIVIKSLHYFCSLPATCLKQQTFQMESFWLNDCLCRNIIVIGS